MSLVNIFQPGPAKRSKRGGQSAKLGFTQLETRCNPVTNLVDTNADVLAAAVGDAQILTSTPDGRYAVFSSTASDVIPGQNDTPGTRDLFWIDFLTGRRSLVTSAPNDNGLGLYSFKNEVTFGRRFAGVEPFGNGRAVDINGAVIDNTDVGRPVISDDGQVVSFISKVNAGFLDDSVATITQLPSSVSVFGNARTLDPDRGNTTYDAFRWNRSDGRITLMSRTFPRFGQNQGLVEAFGNRTPATNVATSADGSVVAFMSKRDAADVYDIDTATQRNNSVVDTIDSTNDLFYTDFLQITANNPNTTTVMSKIANPGYEDDFRDDNDFFFNEDYGTFGYLAQFSPITNDFFVYDDILNEFDGPTQPGLYNAQVPVAVDPLGRYLSSDGKTATFTSDIHALWTFDPFRVTANITRNDKGLHRDVFLVNLLNTAPGTQTTFRTVTRIDTTDTSLVPTAALRSGDADNSILVRNNPDAVLFTFTVGSSTGRLISKSAVTAQPVSTGQSMELYYAEHPTGSFLPTTVVLVSANDNGNDTAAAPPTAGAGNLDLDPLDQATDRRPNPAGYQITPDGRFVAFTDNSPYRIAGSRITQGNDGQKSNALATQDVFRRALRPITATTGGTASYYTNGALIRISQRSAATPAGALGNSTLPTLTPDGRYVAFQNDSTTPNIVTGFGARSNVSQVYVRDTTIPAPRQAGRFATGTSFLVSQNKDGTAYGDGASTSPRVGSTGGDVGRVLFNSTSGNLITFPPVTAGSSHVYTTELPIVGGGGDGPDMTSTAVAAVSGGIDGSVALSNFAGRGTFDFGDRFNPFPGFGGEVRVAAADVDGDGIPDIVAAPGPGGGPRVRVISGATGDTMMDFFAFESRFTGGIYVAAGDINNDGAADIIVGAGESGGPRVQVYSGADGRKYADFFAYEATFTGGVRVAIGDVNPGLRTITFDDGTIVDVSNASFADIITGAGMGGGPRITAFNGEAIARAFPVFFTGPPSQSDPTDGITDTNEIPITKQQVPLGTTPARLVDFFAYEPTLRNGVNVGVGDLNGDGIMDVVTGAGPGGGPRVLAFDSPSLLTNTNQATVLANLFAFDSSSRNGVRVAVRDIDGDGVGDLVVGQGAGSPSRVRSYAVTTTLGSSPEMIDDQLLFGDFASLNGAWVG